MGEGADKLDLGRLRLSPGEGAREPVAVRLAPVELGGQAYAAAEPSADARLDVSRTTTGYALRLRFGVELGGPCMRCLEPAAQRVDVDAREVDQPGGGDDLRSPYMDGDELGLGAWARDALVLALPNQIVCRPDCRGLCGICGANLNEDPDHAHEREPDPRWAKLSEIEFD